MRPLGKRVAQLRAAHGESLREAAARTGVSLTTIARIETGQLSTNLNRTLKAIADGYGVSMEWLQTGREPRPDRDVQLQAQAITNDVASYVSVVREAMAAGVTPEQFQRYYQAVHRAARAGLAPGMLDMAIDLMAGTERFSGRGMAVAAGEGSR